ncbi:hypothetical protein HID58_090805, partial [Brassica napus]
ESLNMHGSLYLVFLDLVLPPPFFDIRFVSKVFGALAPYHQFVEGVRFTDLFHESSLEMSSARGFLSVCFILALTFFSFGSGNMSVVSPAKVSRDGSFIRWLSLRKHVACRLLCPINVFHQ